MKRVLTAFIWIALMTGAHGSAFAQGVGVGIKGGLLFPDFSSEDLDLKNNVGWQGGLFLGGNSSGVAGAQVEFNILRKKAESEVLSGYTATLDYLQIPVLLKLHSPSSSASSFQIYGVVGPSFDIKLRESLEGLVVSDVTDGFENFDLGGIVGAGIEGGRFLVEVRYSRGFRQINKNLHDAVEIKGHSVAGLVGFRFN